MTASYYHDKPQVGEAVLIREVEVEECALLSDTFYCFSVTFCKWVFT